MPGVTSPNRTYGLEHCNRISLILISVLFRLGLHEAHEFLEPVLDEDHFSDVSVSSFPVSPSRMTGHRALDPSLGWTSHPGPGCSKGIFVFAAR
jgi:hypothetical protein